MSPPSDGARPVTRHRVDEYVYGEDLLPGEYVKAADYDALRADLDLRTSEQIVHNGQALACSEPVMDAYEVLRAEVDSLRETCEMQRMFITALGNELRGVGCTLDETPKIVNVRAEAAEAKVAKTTSALINANQEFDYLSNRRDLSAEERGRFVALARLTDAALNEGDGE